VHHAGGFQSASLISKILTSSYHMPVAHRFARVPGLLPAFAGLFEYNKNTSIFRGLCGVKTRLYRAYLSIKCVALVWHQNAHVPGAVMGIRVHIMCTNRQSHARCRPHLSANAKRRVCYFGPNLQNLHKFTRKTIATELPRYWL